MATLEWLINLFFAYAAQEGAALKLMLSIPPEAAVPSDFVPRMHREADEECGRWQERIKLVLDQLDSEPRDPKEVLRLAYGSEPPLVSMAGAYFCLAPNNDSRPSGLVKAVRLYKETVEAVRKVWERTAPKGIPFDEASYFWKCVAACYESR
jgi:hypothetical protein